MEWLSFKDWLVHRESSASTRLRRDAALGLKPPIPSASLHSRSTASPFEVEKLSGKKKGKKGKKTKNIVMNKDIDKFLDAVGSLKDDAKVAQKEKECLEKKEKQGKLKDDNSGKSRRTKRKGE